MCILDWTIDLVYQAGALLRANLEHERQVDEKSRANIVTDADQASERLIIAAIHARFPDHSIVSEEGNGVEGTTAMTWLVDPLDGTTNYAHAFPTFAVSIGLLDSEGPLLGVVYDPLRNEVFAAERGSGARCNGRRINVSTTAHLDAALLSTGFPYDRFTRADNNLREFGHMLLAAQDVRRTGSAALDLAAIAAGRSDGHWEIELSPWDTAAGAILVTEAGGTLSGWHGEPWNVWDKRLVASNGHIHPALLATLNPRNEA